MNGLMGWSVCPSSVPFVVSQSVSQCVNQSVSQTIKQTVSLSASQSISVSQLASQSVSQSVRQSVNQSFTGRPQFFEGWVRLSTWQIAVQGKPCYPLDSDLCGGYWSVGRSVSQLASQPDCQTVSQSVRQTLRQSDRRSVQTLINQVPSSVKLQLLIACHARRCSCTELPFHRWLVWHLTRNSYPFQKPFSLVIFSSARGLSSCNNKDLSPAAGFCSQVRC